MTRMYLSRYLYACASLLLACSCQMAGASSNWDPATHRILQAVATYTVKTSASAGGTISPTPSTSVSHGERATFTVTPAVGYAISSVTGCGVTGSGNTYTTGAITADCQVAAVFYRLTYTVNSATDGGGSISPTPTKVVFHGDTATFTVTPGYRKEVLNIKGCDGQRTGNSYTTGPITTACGVVATFKVQLSSGTDGHGTITPAFADVQYGKTTTFTVTPHTGYTASVAGCNGTLSGTTYTTGPVTAYCHAQATFSRKSYTVTSTASAGGSISPKPSTLVLHGNRATFTVTPAVGYAISSVTGCDGTLSGNTYTTGPITADCKVSAVFYRLTYTVNSATDGGGTISPTPSKVVFHGDTATFNVTPGYRKEVLDITGCNGKRTGNSYTTSPITAACNVYATFKVRISSGTDRDGTITPAFFDVQYGKTATFTVMPHTGYTASVEGCNGTLSGTNYTTGPITAYCHVQATFSQKTYTVTSTASTGGTISPTPSKSVPHGAKATFVVTPSVGYAISSVSGCNGTRSDNSYTTGPVTAACQVSATFTASSYTVTAMAGANGSITPQSKAVDHGQTTTFTVTPDAGYTAVVKGCGGTLFGNMYTTGPITAACEVSATFSASSHTVTATAGANGTITPPSKTVSHGQTTTFNVTPDAGYTPTVTGCGGTLSGNTYTTGAITSACTVSATFTAEPSVQTIYLHTDVLGSVILETDASGNVKKRTEYKPFGESKDN